MASADLIAITSMLPKILYAGQPATGGTDLVAPAANHASVIKSAAASNPTGSAATLTVTVTKSGGSSVTLISASIAAGDSTVLTEVVGAMLGPGDKIAASASTASSVVVVLTGTDNS